MLNQARADSLSGSIVIRDTGDRGLGVFSVRPLEPGEVAVVGTPVARSPVRTWQTLQIGDIHVRMDVPFEFANHSCDPTCGVRPNRHRGYDLVARRAVAPGEEITFDYCMTEWEIVGFTECRCGSERCRTIVRGASFLSPETLEAYDGFLAPHLPPMLTVGVGRESAGPDAPRARRHRYAHSSHREIQHGVL